MKSLQSLFKIIISIQPQNSTNIIEWNLPIDQNEHVVYLHPVFREAGKRGIVLDKMQIFYLDYSERMMVFLGVFPVTEDVTIPVDSIVNNSIEIHCKQVIISQRDILDEIEIFDEVNNKNKNKKVKQRTIQEAIIAVREWRKYYNTADKKNGGRLYTLEQAALKVGMAKKTLNDYYNHLKIARQFNFNLEKYQFYKIGTLRKFVKVAKLQKITNFKSQVTNPPAIQTSISQYFNDFSNI